MSLFSKTLRGAALATAFTATASAHHSFNMYDYNHDLPLAGTITSFTWSNPHGQIVLDVPQAGGTDHWSIELSSPNILGRRGWSSHSLHAGEKVSLVVHPMRDGRKVALLSKVVTPEGKTLVDVAGAIKKDE